MVIFKDLFGQKEKTENKDYEYDIIPPQVRQKVFFIIKENSYHYEFIEDLLEEQRIEELGHLRYLLCKHRGVPEIYVGVGDSGAIENWIKACTLLEFLQTIEMFLWLRNDDRSRGCNMRLERTVKEINDVFEIHKIGYEIIDNKIVRKDSGYLHKEVIKECMSLLKEEKFKSALDEFGNALEKYRLKEYKESITYANASFESVMKIVLGRKAGAANVLIPKLLNHEIGGNRLIPNYYQSFIENFKKILQVIPITRNEKGKGLSHGSGKERTKEERSFVELVLHLTGSLIVFIVRRNEELNS